MKTRNPDQSSQKSIRTNAITPQQLTKAALVLATTTAAYAFMKSTGAVSQISSWFSTIGSEDNALEIANDNNSSLVMLSEVDCNTINFSNDQYSQDQYDVTELVSFDSQITSSISQPSLTMKIAFCDLAISSVFLSMGQTHMAVMMSGLVCHSNVVEAYPVCGEGGEFNVSDLDGTNGLAIINSGDTEGPNDAGYSVSYAGDVNGDAKDDILVSVINTRSSVNNEYGAGKAYVLYGGQNFGSSGEIELSITDSSQGFIISGTLHNENTGTFVSNAGDINSDGYDDIIVGLGSTSPNKYSLSYVIFGSRTIANEAIIDLSSLSNNGFAINSSDYQNAANAAGDINNDNISDIIVSMKSANQNAGKCVVIFGDNDIGSGGVFNLSSINGSNGFEINGVTSGDEASCFYRHSGDFNNDNVDDVLIGSPGAAVNGNAQAGQVYVLFGGAKVGESGVISLGEIDGMNGVVLDGVAESDFTGQSISWAGDFNKDSVDDIIVSSKGASEDICGLSYIVCGANDIFHVWGDYEIDLNLVGVNYNGVKLLGFSGHTGQTQVSYAGDINDDGVADVVVGNPQAKYSCDAYGHCLGQVYVVFGNRSLEGAISLENLDGNVGFLYNGRFPSENSGYSDFFSGYESLVALSNAGDFNDDGVDDLIIGASDTYSEKEDTAVGAAYVIYCSSNYPDSVSTDDNQFLDDDDSTDNSTFTTIIVAVASTVGLGFIALGIWYHRRLNEDPEVTLKRTEKATLRTLTRRHGELLIPIDQIERGDEIGRGGYGVVYRGVCYGEAVAIKQYRKHCFTKAMLEELQTMRQLHSKYLVRLYGVAVTEEQVPWVVMECMRISLYGLLHSQSPINDLHKHQIMTEMVLGLMYLHEHNILHCDIKSLNVLLTDKWEAKLADFGMSRLVDNQKPKKKRKAKLTPKSQRTTTDYVAMSDDEGEKTDEEQGSPESATQTLAGSPRWMAPELLNTGRHTQQTDVYALAVVFWEMLTRQVPYQEASSNAIVIKWIQSGVKLNLPEDCQDDMKNLLQSCWDDSSTRPTAPEIKAQLDQCRPTKASVDMTNTMEMQGIETQNPMMRNRPTVDVDSALLSGVGFFENLESLGSDQGSDQRQRAEQKFA